jgi:hypothetical protein
MSSLMVALVVFGVIGAALYFLLTGEPGRLDD